MNFPNGLSPRAWLDAHVNLETGVGAPAATRERGVFLVAGSALVWSFGGAAVSLVTSSAR